MNLFFGPEKDVKNQTGIKLTHENSYTIPANVKITVENYSSTGIVFNSCSDLKVKKDDSQINPPNC
jgi:hypothetical protein